MSNSLEASDVGGSQVVLEQNSDGIGAQLLADDNMVSEQQDLNYEAFFQHSPLAIPIIGLNGRFLKANKVFMELLGYTEAEIATLTIDAITHDADRQACKTQMDRLLDEDIHKYQGEHQFLKKSGEAVWCKFWVRMIRDDAGNPSFLSAAFENIHEEKAARELLRKQQAWSNAFASALPDIGFIKDEDGRYLEILGSKETLNREDVQRLRGRVMEEVLLPEDAKRFRTVLHATIESGESQTLEYPMDTATGEIRWFLARTSLIDELIDGKKAIVWICHDITGRKSVERELAMHSERLNLAILGANDAIWDWTDVTRDEEWWSPRFYELLGYAQGEIMPSQTTYRTKLIHPDDLDRTAQVVNDCIENDIPLDLEFRFKTKENGYKWFRAKGNVIRDPNGGPARMTGSFADIHEEKLVAEALRESEERFRVLADSAPALIWISGEDGLCNHFNQRWTDFTGRSLEEELGEGWKVSVHPDDLETIERLVGEAFEQQKPFEITFRLKRHDGQYRWILDTGVPRFDSLKQFQGFIGSGIDITEQKEIQQELQAMNKELEQFVYVASHDLQEPLRTVTSLIGILHDHHGEDLSESGKRSMRYIKEAAGRMSDLIKGLLDYSRIGRNRALSKIDCQAVVTNIQADLQSSIEESGTVMQVGNLPTVNGYETELRLLFQNLISNAIKFRKKEEPLQVQISANMRGDNWEFSISDNGIGIAPEHQTRIFEIFQRLHTRSEYEGTGIGLSHCNKIVELHRGTLSVKSTLGEGSTFHFTIPK